jgi:Flp pilus assembly pilin Flp
LISRVLNPESSGIKFKEDTIMKLLMKLFKEEEGAGLVEYALLVAFIALAVIAGVTIFGETLNTWFGSLAEQIPGGVEQ